MSIFGDNIDLEPIRNRLSALEAEVQTFGSTCRALELEWIETYDKVARQMSRMAKRYAVDHAEITPASEPETTGGDGNRMDSISAKILARRAGNGVKP